MLELFVVYPSGRSWTAELLRRDPDSEQWRTVFAVTQGNVDAIEDADRLTSRLADLWPGRVLIHVRPNP